MDKVKVYNYADDNTASYAHKKADTMKTTLETESCTTMTGLIKTRCKLTQKYSRLSVGPKTSAVVKSFNIAGQEIVCQDVVKLLGTELDYMLNFDTQMSNICYKAARQLTY